MALNHMVVVTFGDSTTAPRAGVISYTEQVAPRFLGSRRKPYFFLNAGLRGDTTVKAEHRFKSEVLTEKPSVVVIQFGINDSTIDVWMIPPSCTPRTPIDVFEANIRFFIKECRAVGSAVILMTPNQLRWTPEMLRIYGRRPYQPTEERGFTFILDRYVEVLRKIAVELAVPFVDVYALYDAWEAAHGRSCSELLHDGVHPNTTGHTLVAEALLPLLQRALYQS